MNPDKATDEFLQIIEAINWDNIQTASPLWDDPQSKDALCSEAAEFCPLSSRDWSKQVLKIRDALAVKLEALKSIKPKVAKDIYCEFIYYIFRDFLALRNPDYKKKYPNGNFISSLSFYGHQLN